MRSATACFCPEMSSIFPRHILAAFRIWSISSGLNSCWLIFLRKPSFFSRRPLSVSSITHSLSPPPTHLLLPRTQRLLLVGVAGDLAFVAFDDVNELLAIAQKHLLLVLQLQVSASGEEDLWDLLADVDQNLQLIIKILLVQLQTSQLALQILVFLICI